MKPVLAVSCMLPWPHFSCDLAQGSKDLKNILPAFPIVSVPYRNNHHFLQYPEPNIIGCTHQPNCKVRGAMCESQPNMRDKKTRDKARAPCKVATRKFETNLQATLSNLQIMRMYDSSHFRLKYFSFIADF